MEWSKMFPQDRKPTMEDIAEYIGGDARNLWESLIKYMETAYKAAPKLSYSVCSGKPGWNIKFQKSGQSFGTLYPEENSFSVFIVISYKLEPRMEGIIDNISSETTKLYRQAGDYMKLGKWMMLQIKDQTGVEDYKQMMSVKLAPKYV